MIDNELHMLLESIAYLRTNNRRSLAALLGNTTDAVRRAAIAILIESDEYNDIIRSYAIDIASDENDYSIINQLKRISSSDPSARVRECALRALVNLTGVSSIPLLAHALHMQNAEDRISVVKAATLLPTPAVIQFLISQTLEHPDKSIQFIGALYLAYRGNQSGESILKSSIESTSGILLPPNMVYASSVCALALSGDLQSKMLLATALNQLDKDPLGISAETLQQILRKFAIFSNCSDDQLLNNVRFYLANQ